jgi:hypothetical protein
MIDICLPMPTAEEARAAFGNDFNPDKTLNGAIALAAAGDLAGPALALERYPHGMNGAWTHNHHIIQCLMFSI